MQHTSSIVIDISELRSAASEEIKELEKFLKDKTTAKVEITDREITLKPEEKGKIPSKDYVKVLLKKYLHKADLRLDFRVIAGKEGSLIIKGRKRAAETE